MVPQVGSGQLVSATIGSGVGDGLRVGSSGTGDGVGDGGRRSIRFNR